MNPHPDRPISSPPRIRTAWSRQGAQDPAPFLTDSWNRLAWVETQVQQVRALCQPWMHLPLRAPLTITVDLQASSEGHIEFIADVLAPPDLPWQANFIVGDIATDARSCLDMAMTSIFHEYDLEDSASSQRVKAQFPLEDDYVRKTSSGRNNALKRFLALLPQEFVQVIELFQPTYPPGPTLPMNISALFISYFSNANKHRNITPLRWRTSLSSYSTSLPGLHLQVLSTTGLGSAPVRMCLDYEATEYSYDSVLRFLTGLSHEHSTALDISIDQRIVIDGQDIPIRFGGGDVQIDMTIPLDSFLTKVPAYVRLILQDFTDADSFIKTGRRGIQFWSYDARL